MRILCSVEGQTEEKFVKEILVPHFTNKSIFIQPIIIDQNPRSIKRQGKGGIKSFNQIISELKKLLNDHFAYVTTMYDMYKFPLDSIPDNISIKALEEKLREELNNRRFIPYLQCHEFEALVLADPEIAATLLQVPISEFDFLKDVDPEEVNTTSDGHPSARLFRIAKKHNSNYNKIIDGLSIVENIGIETLQNKCPHFAAWIQTLENLATSRI